MRKLTALIAGGAGYVLGARAGRQRYEQLRNQFQKVKSNPKVQETASKAAGAANKAAPVLKGKVSGVTGKATSSSGSDPMTTTTPTPTSYSTGTTTTTGAAMGTGLVGDEVIVTDLTDDTTAGPLTQPDVLGTDGDSTTYP